MNSEKTIELTRKLCEMRKDTRYRAGFIDATRHHGLITQRQWLSLRDEFTDYNNYEREDAYLRRIGQ